MRVTGGIGSSTQLDNQDVGQASPLAKSATAFVTSQLWQPNQAEFLLQQLMQQGRCDMYQTHLPGERGERQRQFLRQYSSQNMVSDSWVEKKGSCLKAQCS